MRILKTVTAILSLLAVAGCSPSGGNSGEPDRTRSGPYIGGAGGFTR